MEFDFIELILLVLFDRVCCLLSFIYWSIDYYGYWFFWSVCFDVCFYKNLDLYVLYCLRKLEKLDWFIEKIFVIFCWV